MMVVFEIIYNIQACHKIKSIRKTPVYQNCVEYRFVAFKLPENHWFIFSPIQATTFGVGNNKVNVRKKKNEFTSRKQKFYNGAQNKNVYV